MANQQIGNVLGVTRVGPGADGGKIAEVLTDVVNGFTVDPDDLSKFTAGQTITFRVKAGGAGFGTTQRQVTGIASSTNTVTYNGADVALVPGTHAIYTGDVPYATNSTAGVNRSNINGSASAGGTVFDGDFMSIDALKGVLTALDPTTFTPDRLNRMTMNDMVYAVRVKDDLAGIR